MKEICFAEHSFESLNALFEEIRSLGYDEETAGRYAAAIGDLPIMDSDGNIVVMEGRNVIARLKLKYFGTW